LFILSLVISQTWQSWRKLLVLVTSFTVGHCLTLALSSSGFFSVSTYWVELLIPFTIFSTAFYQWRKIQLIDFEQSEKILFYMAGFFGLIHGLGFAKTLHSILGKSQSIFIPLFGFNVGLEAGQLAFLMLLLSLQVVLFRIQFVNITLYNKFLIALCLLPFWCRLSLKLFAPPTSPRFDISVHLPYLLE
jgi:hypothetical protein